uniref:Uncharacterized protein n=1 Tax=Acrobeloides nanus TaxID=290746 RepID=A0A914D1G0_9BILA
MIAKPVKKFPLFKPLDTGLPSVFNAPELVYPSIYNEPKPRRPSVFKEPEPTRPSFLKAPESNRISVFKEPEPQLPSIFKEPEPVCPQTPSLASVHDISVVPETPLQDISVVPETPATIINRRGREQEFPTPGTFSYKGPMDFFVNRHKTRPVNYEENIKESLAKLIKEKRQQEEEESEEPVFKVPRLLPNRVVQSKTATNIPTAVVPPLPTQPKPSTFDLAHQKPVAKPTRDLILSQANSPSRPIKHFAPQPKPARRPADNFNRTISTVLAADYAFAEEPMLFQKTSKVLSTTSPLYEPQKIESLAKPPHERFLMNRSMPPQLDDLPRQDPTNWETSVSPENRITSVLHELQPSRFESALQDLKKEYQIVNSNRPSQLSLADRLKQLAYKSIPYHNTSSGNF